MRKLLILCFLCFTWIARGQDEYRWHYWFDANHDAVVSGTTQSRFFTIDADASDLDFGAHTFNIQVEGKDGKMSSPISRYFYYSNSKLDKLTYWFDNDTQGMKEESSKDGHFLLDVSSIEPGIHFINLMLKDASGRISEIKQECFYRVINKTATKMTYWFDDDESTKETIAFHDGSSMFDVTKLQEGFHTISIVTHDYTSSAIATRMFIKVPQIKGDFDMTCICSVDGKLVAQDKMPSTGGILNFNLDVNSIAPGLHKAIFQTITPTGAASNTVERYFIRTITNNEIASMKCYYTIDETKTFIQAGNFANGLFHFDLDVASLDDGLHRLTYMLIDDKGASIPMQSAFFWKTPVGGNAIIQYDYWLNDNEVNAKKVSLTEHNNPFSLITLLPVESCPIRSSCFQFEVNDGKPMMYARNDIHFRFFDTAARLVEATKQFIDYSVSQEVTDIFELQSTQTFACPAENTIRWYKFNAEVGDTIALKSSQATSIQVFSPSGKEVYSASGDKAVKFDGCHTWEDGTYYVAVHDVTGTKPDITLDYVYISEFILGDANCDKIIDVADNATIASYILGLPTKIFRRRAADFNLDNDVDVADITTIIDVIFESDAKEDIDLASDPGKQELIAKSGESCLQLKLANTGNEFSAFQTDIDLPAGVEVEKITTDTKHNIAWRRVAENTVRVMIYSLANETFSVSDELLNLVLRGQEQLAEINIVNGIAARPDGSKEKILDCSSLVSISNPTGIEGIQQETDEQIYNVRGQKLQKSGRGVNIIRSDNDTRKVMKQ